MKTFSSRKYPASTNAVQNVYFHFPSSSFITIYGKFSECTYTNQSWFVNFRKCFENIYTGKIIKILEKPDKKITDEICKLQVQLNSTHTELCEHYKIYLYSQNFW